MKKIILLAAIAFFLIAPITYHPDTKLTLRYPALENGKVWDIYGYINSHKLDIPNFHYPPAHYWWLKIHYPISKFIGGRGFDTWMASGSAQASFEVKVLKYNLAAKFPLLLLGLLSGFLIYLIVKRASSSEKSGRMAALFWYFNPITIYSLVIMGQNDIVAITLFLLGVLYYEKWWLTALLWGLASGVKSYPIIWAIMFYLVFEKNIFRLIRNISAVFAVYGLVLLPWLGKDYFTQAVLNSGLSQRMFISSLPIGFAKEILIVPLLLTVIGLKAWADKNKDRLARASFRVFQSCLVILAFSHFNPQWMLWTVPFLSIWIFIAGVRRGDVVALLAIFASWLVLCLGFDDKFLTWGLLSPLNPGLIYFPSMVEYARNKGFELSQLIDLGQSVLAGVSLWYLGNKLSMSKKRKYDFKVKNFYILVLWFLVVLLIFLLANLTVENKSESRGNNVEISLSETSGKKWSYDVEPNLKYFEISLNNPGLNSQDKGKLVVFDENNNSFVKEFSGFNAEGMGWLRVDVPENMRRSENITIETKDIETKDALLKLSLDDRDRWAINFYNKSKPSLILVTQKLLALWWWWIALAGVSVFYFRVKED